MEDTQGYSTIDSVVRSECLAQDDLNLSKYMRFLSFGLEAIKDWNLDKKNNIKVISQVTSSLATLPFPADYVKWSRIGTVSGDRVKTMVVNNKLALSNTLDDCGQPVANTAYQPKYPPYNIGPINSNNLFFYSYPYNDGSGNINGFGNSYMNDGQFRVDRENRRFQFSSDWANCTIYLEYVGTGLNPTADTVIDENAAKSIKFYIRWQDLEARRDVSIAEKMRAEQQYWQENLTASKRVLDIDLDKILGLSRDSIKTSQKT